MTIVVEDGTAKSNANSYASVADADAYWTLRNDPVWIDLDVEVKESALVKAADYMLQTYRAQWKGYRKSSTQSLDWPRSNVPMPDVYATGYAYLADNVVPVEVKNACIELAYKASSTELMPDNDRITISETVGPLSVTYDRSGPTGPVFSAVNSILMPYISGGASSNTINLARV
jgi:hypothetical protein